MTRWNAPFEIEKVKQPALIAALPTHHDPTPPLKTSTKRNHDSPIISTTFSTVSVNSRLAASQEARLLYLQKLPRRWPLLRTVCIKFPRLGNLVHKPA